MWNSPNREKNKFFDQYGKKINQFGKKNHLLIVIAKETNDEARFFWQKNDKIRDLVQTKPNDSVKFEASKTSDSHVKT